MCSCMRAIPEFGPISGRQLVGTGRLRFRLGFKAAVAVLCISHFAVLLGGFIAPYDFTEQNRLMAFAPPMAVHFFDTRGRLHFRPFVYQLRPCAVEFGCYEDDRSTEHPIHFWVSGPPYKILGLFSSRTHLFGISNAARIFLAGTDAYGRDQFSRLLYGGQVSLFAGLFATAISLTLGMIIGATAGFYGNWIDEAIMRAAEVFLALPWLYLLFAVRAFLPLHIAPDRVFYLLIAVIGTIGWARPARLIRGVTASAKQRGYVLAAKGFGASNIYLLRRHVLPQASSVALTQAAVFVPQYILAEVTLSFLGLGVSEPMPSWGNMLAVVQQYEVLRSYWWMLLPVLLLIPLFLAYYVVFAYYSNTYRTTF
jgi:peptide/nickel transport system permease protein